MSSQCFHVTISGNYSLSYSILHEKYLIILMPKASRLPIFFVNSHEMRVEMNFPVKSHSMIHFLRENMSLYYFKMKIDNFYVKLTVFYSAGWHQNLASISSLGRNLKPNFDAIFWCIPLSKIYAVLTNFFVKTLCFTSLCIILTNFVMKTLFLTKLFGWFSKLKFSKPFFDAILCQDCFCK